MLLNAFKVGGFKLFGEVVELNLNPKSKNTSYLSDNIIETKFNKKVSKNLKSSIVYGGNNSGKSTLLNALMIMKKIFTLGGTIGYPFEDYRNFTFESDNITRYEIDFNDQCHNYIYGFEFEDEKSIGEYLYLNDVLMFSRDLKGYIEGEYLEKILGFKDLLNNLKSDKLVIPYIVNYTQNLEAYDPFIKVQNFFEKLKFIDNRRNDYSINVLNNFMKNKSKVDVLNKLIATTELHLESRMLISEQELINSEYFKRIKGLNNFDDSTSDENMRQGKKDLLESLKVTSIYKNKDGEYVNKPSLIFDSVGTNKFINLSMYIINALFDGDILLIDEFDSSLHHKLTRVLVILMNSKANTKSQFVMTTHDVNLLSSSLFRKDQINFILRTEEFVEIISLDDFKSNSKNDIRSTSNFEKMYLEEKIIPLPDTNIYEVIKSIINE